MKPTQAKPKNASYLDVSDLIMKEYSPVFKPKPHTLPPEVIIPQLIKLGNILECPLVSTSIFNDFFQIYEIIQNLIAQSPIISQISPIIQARVSFPITPVFDRSKSDPLREPSLDDLEDFYLDGRPGGEPRKATKRARRYSTYHIADNQLENIIEEGCSSQSEDGMVDQQEESEIQQINQEQQEQYESEDIESGMDNKSTNYQFKSPEWQALNPKKELVSKIKVIVADAHALGIDEKFGKIKLLICKYICDYQQYYFEESMETIKRTHQQLNEIIQVILKGIDQTFKKIIGGLSFEKRRIKLLRYLDKKKRRVWKKKVNYDCRKKVADKRLRIKGKFVTMDQACEQLGKTDLSGYSLQQIKQMLQQKIEQN